MGMTVDFAEVRKKMDEMSKKVAKTLADDCLDAAEKPIKRAMINNVPKDTGKLKSSIDQIKRTGSGAKRKTKVGVKSEDRKIITRGFYQEYGTARMLGKKWMKKSFELSKSEANQEIIKVIREKLF